MNMKQKLLRVVKLLAMAVLLFYVTVFVLIYFATQDVIEQTTGPVSREQAVKHCPIKLPLGAHNIQYASLAGGLQDCEQFVHFEAQVSECHSHAESIFAECSKNGLRKPIPQFQPVSHPHKVVSSRLRTEWFDNERIAKGVVAGEGTGSEPRIWIDEERGIFYYFVTD